MLRLLIAGLSVPFGPLLSGDSAKPRPSRISGTVRLVRPRKGRGTLQRPAKRLAIDRLDNGRVYYINSRRYRFHHEFLAADYLTLERGRKFCEQNFLSPQRRFLLGTIARAVKTDQGRGQFLSLSFFG